MKPVLITAGATRNPIDAMRYISAHATGRTGAMIASRLMKCTEVTALCSPLAATHMPPKIHIQEFRSTTDLMSKMTQWVVEHPACVVVHSAAVGDYEVRQPSTQSKIPSGQGTVTIELQPTPKILDCIQDWSSEASVVSFKAAAPTTSQKELETLATKQLLRSNSELVFANTIGNIDRQVMLVRQDGAQRYPTRKEAIEALALFLQDQVTSTGSD